MFGRPSQTNGSHPQVQRPAAADIAKIGGGGLVQLIVSSLQPLTFALFLNDQAVSELDVESLSISIETPTPANGDTTTVRATLSRYVATVSGSRSLQRQELFPCNLEIIALGRRIALTALSPDSLDGLYINLGLRPDGTSSELSGVSAFRFLLTEGLLDAKLTWEDGETEDLLPQ
ncbi:MAG TPA: hypothetical protein VKU00_22025 [Chthonomonadaceae bacterium]|nr:hypothetical protein [Chthonomonadaceae bacterium]